MKNQGLFSALFLEDLRGDVALDDAARGRMATLAHAWKTGAWGDAASLWEGFLKPALGYLEFVPPVGPEAPGVYPLYEDWNRADRVAVLCLVEPGGEIDDVTVGRFHPARLIARLREHGLDWGILTDGARWRLYSTRSSRPFEDYVELDLAAALDEEDEAGYGLFERFFHRDAFVPDEGEDAGGGEGRRASGTVRPGCPLDRERERSEQALEKRVKKPLLGQVDGVLRRICNGFIREATADGRAIGEAVKDEIYESAVKLIYRCLFLFYAEARALLPSDAEKADEYRKHSMQALCREAREFRWGGRRDTEGYDLWSRLKGLVRAVNEGDPEYGIMGYDGGLFDDEKERFLGRYRLRNDFLAPALYRLAFVEPEGNDPDAEYAIPYQDLEVRHLGELYESILEWTVQIADADRIRRPTKKGFKIRLASGEERRPGDTLIRKGEAYFSESALERKQTGSYYTPQSLVRFLNEKTIVRPLREAFEGRHRRRFDEFRDQARKGHDEGARRGAAQSAVALVERFVEEEVLAFKVCDPAMGSGHFLVDAANQMAGLVVSLLEEVPDVEGAPAGVTSRPNDWRRLITRHCLYGVDLNPLAVELARLSLWLNGFARDHKLTFLDHHLRRGNSLIGIRALDPLGGVPARKKGGRKKDAERVILDYGDPSGLLAGAAKELRSIGEIDEDDTEGQSAALDRARAATSRLRPLADLYTAYLMDPDIRAGEYEALFNCLATDRPVENTLDPLLPEILKSVEGYRDRHGYFHWPLEFPDLFGPDAPGGFSATVGNPPWDIVKPNSQEFFSAYDKAFRSYKKQEANRVSQELMSGNPDVAGKWKAYCDAIAEQSAYFREPLAYDALGKGDINTFKLFLERFFEILSDRGRMGIVVPSGIYTDQGCRPLREMFFERSEVDFLYGFENRWPTVFSAVDGREKFVLLGVRKGGKTDRFRCAFMEHDPERLPAIDANALEMGVEHVRKFSPDTLSVMEFKSQRDIDITTKIYGDWPLLGEKLEGTWNVRFRSELHMTNDSHLFKTEPTDCPLYEGKMIWLFDSHFEQPRYWLDREEVEKALRERAWEGRHYRVGFRDIAASTNERTLISSMVPPCWIGNTLPTVIPKDSLNASVGPNSIESTWLASLLSSFSADFVIRQKVTNHMNFFYMRTLPVPRWTSSVQGQHYGTVIARAARLLCVLDCWDELWRSVFSQDWQSPDFWYPPSVPIDDYGPEHEREIRRRLRDEAVNLTPEWGPHCGVHDRLPDRRDTGDRAQLRAEIDAYVAHLYGLSRDDFAYILDTFPVLKKKEKKAFGEFMSKRKCLEEYDRIGRIG